VNSVDTIVNPLTWGLSASIPVYVAWRLARNGRSAVFNVLLYPLVLSYAYLLLPTLVTTDTPLAAALQLSKDSLTVTNALSAWYVVVFFVAYALTSDPDFEFYSGFRAGRHLAIVSRFLQVATACTLAAVLLRHGPVLAALSSDRGVAYEYYAANILNTYKLSIVFPLCAASCTVLYLSSGRRRELTPLLLFAALDALQGGRGFTLSSLIVAYLNITARNRRAFGKANKAFAVVALGVFASTFVRRHVLANESSSALIDFIGEFYYTRLTARYVYDYASATAGAFVYLGTSLSRLLPQFLISPLIENDQSFVSSINKDIDAGFGLAGSILSEPLFYGGIPFAVISPVAIAALYWLTCRRSATAHLPRYLLFVLVTSSAHVAFRTGFYMTFFPLIYIWATYLGVFVALGSRKRVFESASAAAARCHRPNRMALPTYSHSAH
jgi:hypothetical protein